MLIPKSIMDSFEFRRQMVEEDNRFIGELKQLCLDEHDDDFPDLLQALMAESKQRQRKIFSDYLKQHDHERKTAEPA